MNSKKVITIIIGILLTISAVSGGLLLVYGYSLNQASDDFNKLAKTFQASQSKINQTEILKDETTEKEQLEEQQVEEKEVSIAFEDLYNQNHDITAWIAISGTRVNYPVMHTPDTPEYYLYRNFDKEYSVSGVPFMDGKSSLDEPSDNILIHGHNMKNGSMFAQLLSYEDEAFFKKHPSIEFSTFDQKEIYDIISVFPAEVYNKVKTNFNYHDFINAKDQSEFDKYVADAKTASLYDTGLRAEYGDQLMTLSTCS